MKRIAIKTAGFIMGYWLISRLLDSDGNDCE